MTTDGRVERVRAEAHDLGYSLVAFDHEVAERERLAASVNCPAHHGRQCCGDVAACKRALDEQP